MKWFNQLSLGQRLFCAFSICALLTIVVGAVGATRMRELAAMQTAMYETEVVPIRQIGTASWQAAAHYRRLYDYVVKTDPKGREETLAFNSKGEAAVTAAIDYERAHPLNDRQKQLVADFDSIWPEYLASVRKVEEAAKQGDQAAALAEMQSRTDGLHVKIRKTLIAFSDVRNDGAQEKALAGVDLVSNVTWWIVACSAVGVIVSLGFGWAVTRSITREVGGEPAVVARAVGDIAAGNLDTDVSTTAGRRAAGILAATAQMRDALRLAVRSIRGGAESVTQASNAISATNRDLSERTERQAASLQQTAATMEELTQTVRQNADNAGQAKSLAVDAADVAATADETVATMLATMRSINDSSSKISDITALIEGIAFQTNILALNAAVEAARAGEQGRGFAVVAGEVRSLAQRASAAAKEIKDLIESSAAIVHDGTAQAGRVGETVSQVKDAIERVSGIVGEIAAASDEQSRGIEEVNQVIGEMDRVTQENAALVQRAASAAELLEQQATELKQAVSVFKMAAA
ncbi:methyl-accepting chemotaxis protein [Trinickia caryophylli]|uniref:Methyl-accepting chemotaxis protein n=1 Tax=Trinickia caryophylli TaxID=28094 RepID=A0A1X7F724_TRICW|nr:methyl-accepting chemotaxis protein [Trinickia caryophylli]PMS09292.1 methyl-accepting chemotaxis protein [Trinickia caryophylli]TRX19367.1 methyl-accepting chemotaxis protein [Trinickia caryophylli]WQE13325.1 methyl-accepting chemotaxis protein [Trinickia caryophylli]SMF46498.1 methyl-accepting chemotaxis protein [Trinickia caryophylli]GLU35802.1 methyl-accepting chemotaxis protein [Trinickia caryophylli]